MKHCYVADVGDFGKYGLLKVLAEECRAVRLGVVWYLTDEIENNKDGKHDGYLKTSNRRRQESYRTCDPVLYDQLKLIRDGRPLRLSAVQNGSILPLTTLFYDVAVPVFAGNGQYAVRWIQRDQWHEAALRQTAGAPLIFTDPDNGIIFTDRETVARRRPSHKHSYWHEIADYLDRGQSVIAYHHPSREKGGHEQHIRCCLQRIVQLGWNVRAVRFRRGTSRAFFVISATNAHDELLAAGVRRYAEIWSSHSSLVGCAGI